MPHLVQILLPLYARNGSRLPPDLLRAVRADLVDRFGGATAFTRAPAEGFWEKDGETVRDDIVVVEVMAEDIDRACWSAYRRDLERRFDQDVVVIRHHPVHLV
jgi:hypothetical protein